MKNRALGKMLIRKVSMWAVKEVLKSLPIIGCVFKMVFFGMDVARAIEDHRKASQPEEVPQLACA